MDNIELKDDDWKGKGTFSEVFGYEINNTQLAVKCFKDDSKAIEENTLMEKISNLVPECPGIIKYYGMKKLNIK